MKCSVVGCHQRANAYHLAATGADVHSLPVCGRHADPQHALPLPGALTRLLARLWGFRRWG